eukprot:TRINITY_DN610_c3_g1_i2.p1 TRINITY_DN610_c3_g1~~TRINITY_DN610_c3_g1_i2.p1  ORF type:complete len:1197 (-),score=350.08 TRINITY_DN610_c3_g1_i2:63-3653(-)
MKNILKRSNEANPVDERLTRFKQLVEEVYEEQSDIKWNDLRVFAEEELDDSFNVDEKYASTLVSFLFEHAGRKEGRNLSDTSKIVLNVLFLLLSKVEEVQNQVERLPTTILNKLRLDNHILQDKDPQHQRLAIKTLLLLQTIPKFKKAETYIPEYKSVRKIQESLKLTDIDPSLPRLSQEGRLSVQASYHDVDVATVSDSFNTNIKTGLPDHDIINRAAQYGPNELPKPKPTSILKILFNQVKDFMIIILSVTAIVAMALEEYKAGGTLFAVILINVTIGFVQEYKAEKALNSMMSLDVPQARVIRDGEVSIIPASGLVPGDIALLEEGDRVPADLRLCEISDLFIIESVLTGESEPVEKTIKAIRKRNPALGDRKNMAYMTTSVTKGRGRGIVVQTGLHTEAGKISLNLATATQPPTPLQRRLDFLGKILVVAAVILCGLIVGIGAAWHVEKVWPDYVKIAISLGVSVIPEGLVAVTTVTMAIGVQRMAKKNAIVRKLSAVETLGSVTVICSDKTGTLTEGKMKATRIWTGSVDYRITGAALNPQGTISIGKKHLRPKDIESNIYLTRSLEICSLCNNAILKTNDDDEYETVGDPTEVACMIAAMRGFVQKYDLINEDGWTFVREFAFDSNRKRMSVIYKKKDTQMILTKGGTESVLSICTTQMLSSKTPKAMDGDAMKKIEKKAARLAARGLRVLALAFREVEDSVSLDKISKAEKNLTFIGLVGIIDPARPEAKAAIAKCRSAGIVVCMITGDHQSTAKAIAKNLGIAGPKDKPLKGVDIDILASTGKLETLNPWPTVFARVSPENKLQIVKALQARQQVVAMTGDGVNDAPAIKNADCGIAMGISGTDITKQVASIVLKDDNFSTIALAVEEGRIIYDNIQKFIVYILSSNSAELLTMLIAVSIDSDPMPFSTMQILWANIIADVPPAMALGIDAPESDVMKRKPRKSTANLFDLRSSLILLCQACSMSLLAIAVLLYNSRYDVAKKDVAQTVCFVGLTTLQLFQGFMSRSRSQSVFRINPLSNKWMIIAVFGSFIVLVASVYIPGVQDVFDLKPLDGWEWLKILIMFAIHVTIVEIFKLISRCCSSEQEEVSGPIMLEAPKKKEKISESSSSSSSSSSEKKSSKKKKKDKKVESSSSSSSDNNKKKSNKKKKEDMIADRDAVNDRKESFQMDRSDVVINVRDSLAVDRDRV